MSGPRGKGSQGVTDEAVAEAEALKPGLAGLLTMWQREKVMQTCKGSKTYTPWLIWPSGVKATR